MIFFGRQYVSAQLLSPVFPDHSDGRRGSDDPDPLCALHSHDGGGLPCGLRPTAGGDGLLPHSLRPLPVRLWPLVGSHRSSPCAHHRHDDLPGRHPHHPADPELHRLAGGQPYPGAGHRGRGRHEPDRDARPLQWRRAQPCQQPGEHGGHLLPSAGTCAGRLAHRAVQLACRLLVPVRFWCPDHPGVAGLVWRDAASIRPPGCCWGTCSS